MSQLCDSLCTAGDLNEVLRTQLLLLRTQLLLLFAPRRRRRAQLDATAEPIAVQGDLIDARDTMKTQILQGGSDQWPMLGGLEGHLEMVFASTVPRRPVDGAGLNGGFQDSGAQQGAVGGSQKANEETPRGEGEETNLVAIRLKNRVRHEVDGGSHLGQASTRLRGEAQGHQHCLAGHALTEAQILQQRDHHHYNGRVVEEAR
mmetsp:Transcript_34623/g.56692  ORF Transcript_34623/g.56692 Transcript_34623/m.56692 type:complete len:203 (-) Transcript_34623:520-1128(-)